MFWVMSLTLVTAAFGYAVDYEDLNQTPLVQPWEEALQHIGPRASPEEQAAAVKDLAQRLLQERSSEFSFSVEPSIGPEGKDKFRVTSPGVNASVDVVGTTGVAAAWGLLHYLKYSCNAHVSWEADQLSLPQPLPPANINVTSNDRLRYYQNVCTVSYSMAWWKWTRWEREIDWMALNGINIPLAFTGQEALWQRVYLKMGLTQEELDAHFAGPAFLAWGRMGNLRGWGGPLPQSWHDQTLALQHQILKRMRELGMTPVLPAFAGHVPAGITRAYPDANVTRLGQWAHFNCTYSCTYLLDPSDPLFQTIGSEFINELTSEFGTDHLYNCDTFNEMTPSSDDPAYLSSVGASVYSAMTDADPDAIWVMQGWLFYSSPLFWRKPQAKALLTSVPIGRMLVLDLAAEVVPQYSRLESYFGQPFVFCMLHNYGGVDGFFGNVDVLLNNMAEARNFPNVTLVGTGLTPEGINQNYVMYDLMNELAWRSSMPNVTAWTEEYAARRYNSLDSRLGDAWNLLMKSVYGNGDKRNHGEYVIVRRPDTRTSEDWIWYSVDDVIKAWDLFIEVIEDSLTETDVKLSISDSEEEEEREESDEKDSYEMEEEEREEDEDAGDTTAYKQQQRLARELPSSSPFSSAILPSPGKDGKQPAISPVDTIQPLLTSDQTTTAKNTSSWGHPSTGMSQSDETTVDDLNKDVLISHFPHGETKVHKGKSPEGRPFPNGEMETKDAASRMPSTDEGNDDRDGRRGYERSRVTKSLLEQPAFLHDVVDVTRQVLQILGGQTALRMIDYYHSGDKFGVQVDSNNLQVMLKDYDDILATSPDFLLGAWTDSAASWATNEQERELYIYNALNQVTLWGPSGEILDYAVKQWSGLMANYIKPRWELFAQKLINSLDEGIPFDRQGFEDEVFAQVEEPMSKDVNASFPAVPTGDTITTALLLHGKYRGFFNETQIRSLQEKISQQSRRPHELSDGFDVLSKKEKKKKMMMVQNVNIGERSRTSKHNKRKWKQELKTNRILHENRRTMVFHKHQLRTSDNSISNWFHDDE